MTLILLLSCLLEAGKEKTEDREQHSQAGVSMYLTVQPNLFAELSEH